MEKLMNEDTKLIGNDNETNNEVRTEKVDVSGLFVRIPNGYEVVSEDLAGHLRIKRAGFRAFFPWETKYVYYVKDTPIDFMKEKFKSKEQFEISIDAAVTYNIVNSIKFHIEKNAIKQLKLVIGDILKSYSSTHTFEEINAWAININLKNIIKDKNAEYSEEEEEAIDKLLDLYYKYGISVSKIIVQKAELSDDLKKSKEEDELTKAKNKRMIETANAELETARIKAEAEKAKGEAESAIIAKRIEYISGQIDKCSPEQLKLIKAVLIGDTANYTVIENGIGDSDYSKMAYFKAGNPMFNLNQSADSDETTKVKTLNNDSK